MELFYRVAFLSSSGAFSVVFVPTFVGIIKNHVNLLNCLSLLLGPVYFDWNVTVANSSVQLYFVKKKLKNYVVKSIKSLVTYTQT